MQHLAQRKNPLICILFSAVPTNAPQIKDSLSEANRGLLYKPGDWLNLNCTSQPSRPPIRLTWFVNGREVSVSLACMSIKAKLCGNTITQKPYMKMHRQKSSMRKSVYLLQGKVLIRNDLSSLLIQLSILRNMNTFLNEGAKGILREVDKNGFL